MKSSKSPYYSSYSGNLIEWRFFKVYIYIYIYIFSLVIGIFSSENYN